MRPENFREFSLGIIRSSAHAARANMTGQLQTAHTLGDVIYGADFQQRVPETEWIAMISAITGRDTSAFGNLYLMTHDMVFTLIVRITGAKATAEAVAIEVFHEVWRSAKAYDPGSGSVIAWIMNLARARALEHGRPAQPEPINDTKAPDSVRERVAKRIANEVGHEVVHPRRRRQALPDWREVAPGIFCKVLSMDALRNRISMLVQLVPGGAYPAHTHADVEELHLLDGELWIDGRKLYPGDYNCAAPGSRDERVWSETGCTCVLVTSPGDILR